ncbi:MAG TPA: tetraacyldisaccharide 4'-kinase, partial [Smithellaceae bacterium]|nr:tetraacyldisaccharide 4'-kinase [Smithellaceae bacterium]
PSDRLRQEIQPEQVVHDQSISSIAGTSHREAQRPFTRFLDEIVRIADASGIPVFRSVHRFKEMVRPQDRLSLPPEDFRGKSVCAFCGIARPASFKKSLLDSGMHILSFIDFPDHYTYKSDDLEAIRKHFSAQNADAWITTEKDAMRLEESPDFLNRLFIARIEMEMQPSTPSFDDFILRRLKKVSNEQRLTSDE